MRTETPTVGKTMSSLTAYFQNTSEFTSGISERTRSDYLKQIKLIDQKFGNFPLSALGDPRSRGIFKEWRDELATKSVRQADYAWTVLARIFSVALDRGKIKENPCTKGGRLYLSERVDKIWTLEDEAAFSRARPRICICPCCSAFGRASARGTSCVCSGRTTTARSFGCGRARASPSASRAASPSRCRWANR